MDKVDDRLCRRIRDGRWFVGDACEEAVAGLPIEELDIFLNTGRAVGRSEEGRGGDVMTGEPMADEACPNDIWSEIFDSLVVGEPGVGERGGDLAIEYDNGLGGGLVGDIGGAEVGLLVATTLF